ncbi:MAG: Uma2 family endonuclease [Hyphomicrobiaceae bacterium]
MLARKPKSPATYADIEALPANMIGQIVLGVLHSHPRPAPRHVRASSRLGAELDGPFDRGRGGPGGWIILDEPELHLADHVIVPDLAGWRRERLPRLPETAYFETPPDWVCEVLSPATVRLDRTDKLAAYAEFKVGHCWLVDPVALTLEVFELREGRWTLFGTYKDADPVGAPPFSVHTFPLDVLWPDDQTLV